MKLKLMLPIFFFTLNTAAEVNMKNASFLSQWLDVSIDGPQGSLELRRLYNSRSAKLGIFGFGWCSPYEKNLFITEKTAILSDCTLEKDKVIENVERTPAGFHLQNENEEMKFDKEGRLTELKLPDGLVVQLKYTKSDKPTHIITNDGRKLELKYDSRGNRVIEVRGSNGVKVKYDYSGSDLKAVIKGKEQARYFYDDLHNLTRIDHPDRRYELITYDRDLDRVQMYRSPAGCTDSFQYTKQDEKHYVSSAERRCAGQIVKRAQYRFQINSKGVAQYEKAHPSHSSPLQVGERR